MTVARPSGWWTACHGDVTQLVNSRCCVLVLLTLAVTHVVIVSVYIPDPMPCFCPSELTNSMCNMLRASCNTKTNATYISGSLASVIPTADEPVRMVHLQQYYQYVSLILILEAILFYTPSIIWKEVARQFGILPDDLAISAVEARHTKNTTDRESATRELAKHVQLFCTRQLRRRHVSYAFWWLHGSKLALWRIMSKMLYGANVIGQFFLLDAFLGMSFHDYGWQMLGRVSSSFSFELLLRSILHAEIGELGFTKAHIDPEVIATLDNITRSALDAYFGSLASESQLDFPKDVFCNVKVRQLGNVHRYTIQCVLPVNPLNETIFKCVWFLLFVAAVVTMASLAITVFKFFTFPCWRMSVRERLYDISVLGRHDPRDVAATKEINTFERSYLQRDGHLLIGYIEAAAGDVIADEVLGQLWETYKENSFALMRMSKSVKWTEEEVETKPELDEERPTSYDSWPRSTDV